MAEAPKKDEQQKQTEAAPKQAPAAAPSKKAKLAHPAPSEWDGLPEGVNGGPATADNPEESALLSTKEERADKSK